MLITCPFHDMEKEGVRCDQSDCALWDKERERCAFLTIAIAMAEMVKKDKFNRVRVKTDGSKATGI